MVAIAFGLVVTGVLALSATAPDDRPGARRMGPIGLVLIAAVAVSVAVSGVAIGAH